MDCLNGNLFELRCYNNAYCSVGIVNYNKRKKDQQRTEVFTGIFVSYRDGLCYNRQCI